MKSLRVMLCALPAGADRLLHDERSQLVGGLSVELGLALPPR